MAKNLLNFNNAMIFLFILALIMIIKGTIDSQKINDVNEAEVVMDKLTNGYEEISLIDSNELKEEKIKNLDQMEYNAVKRKLGVKTDFCIYFEDLSGNILKFDNINLGIGSDKIHINGEPCK